MSAVFINYTYIIHTQYIIIQKNKQTLIWRLDDLGVMITQLSKSNNICKEL